MSLPKKNGSFQPYFGRKEEHHIFHIDRNGTSSRLTIGILGCDSGVGVTHLAIALSSYCRSKLRKKVAYLELHKRNEITQLVPESSIQTCIKPLAAKSFADFPQCCPYFRLYGVDYYPNVAERMIPTLFNLGYEILILDIGSLKETDYLEFLRCDQKLVLGSAAPWKLWHYEEYFRQFDNTKNLGEGFHYLLQMGTLADISHFMKSHHISMRQVPFIKNPFHIEKELFLFLEELLTEPINSSVHLLGIR